MTLRQLIVTELMATNTVIIQLGVGEAGRLNVTVTCVANDDGLLFSTNLMVFSYTTTVTKQFYSTQNSTSDMKL